MTPGLPSQSVEAEMSWEGSKVEQAIDRMFANPCVAYLHLHNAKPGCYAARVDRPESRGGNSGWSLWWRQRLLSEIEAIAHTV